jgi:glutamate-1-semialdehyde 2,1-aminomutase
MNPFTRSNRAFQQSQSYLAGGVSSMMRAAAKPAPLFFRSASGATLTDFDGRRYLDYAMGWGPLILGHSHPVVVKAVRKQLEKFQLLGAQHELEIEVARNICRLVPSAQLVAYSNTGTEAVQLALRLARAFTGRQKFVKFEGHYHGWADSVLLSYHPANHNSRPRQAVPASEGQSRSLYKDVFILPWNDPEALDCLLAKHGDEIAAIITEPILCNSGCLLPLPGYLEEMRRLSRRHNIVLIFDEVITGFRASLGGAQSLLGVFPDLTILGKALGAGFPISAVAGRKTIMELIPRKRVVHAGTFNGNPISLAAANAALGVLSAGQGRVLMQLHRRGERLKEGISRLAARAQIPCLLNGIGSVFHLSFTTRRSVRNYRETLDADTQMRDRFIQAMLESGVYLIPDCRWYPSAAHTPADVETALRAVERAFRKIKAQK